MVIDKLPEGFERCESIDCLYRLKKRKKNRTEENLELDLGKELYIYSHYARNYRKYIIENNDPWLEKIKNFIMMGIVYHKPL